MGWLTKKVNQALGVDRNIIPMGRPETKKKYDGETPVRKIVQDMGMDPDRVDVIADGDDLRPDDKIGDKTDITIMPKQRGGSPFDLTEQVSTCVIACILDPSGEDKALWDKVDEYLSR